LQSSDPFGAPPAPAVRAHRSDWLYARNFDRRRCDRGINPLATSRIGARRTLLASSIWPRQTLFAKAFESGAINATNLGLALESFLLSLTSCDSKFDQAMQGKAQLSAAEQRGFELFMTEYEPRSGQYGADCFHCHGGALFTDNRFHDNGLQADHDLGLGAITQRRSDTHHFATPSLRNVALTAPYMDDGRFETLEQVIEHYSSGIQRRATLAPNLSKHPAGGLQLSTSDKAALVASLKALTDPQYEAN
jgi:cytochrome c peroxidase